MSRWRTKRRGQNRRVSDRTRGFALRWAVPFKSLASLGLFAALGYGLFSFVTDPETLPLKQLQLEGPMQRLSAEQLRSVIREHVDGGFFKVDMDEITRALQALPWVDQVSVRRVWPDTLAVSVKEQTPLARWAGGGVVNPRGEIFLPADVAGLESLVVLDGDQSAAKVMVDRYLGISHQLDGVGVGLRAITLTARRSWEIELNNGIAVILGRSETDARLQRFVRVYPGLSEKLADVARIDMRYPNGFSVKWRRAKTVG